MMINNWFFNILYEYNIITNSIIVLIIFSILLIGIHSFKLFERKFLKKEKPSIVKDDKNSLNEFTPLTTLTAALLASLTLIQLTLSQIQINQDFLEKQLKLENHKEFTELLLDYYNNEDLMKIYYKVSYKKITNLNQITNNGTTRFNKDEYLLDSLLRTYNVFCNLEMNNILTKKHLKVLEHDFKVIIDNETVYQYIIHLIDHYKKEGVENKIKYFVKYCQVNFNTFKEIEINIKGENK